MKRINVIWTNRDGLGGEPETVIATNDNGSGLFRRDPGENGYHQMAGNHQTPVFRTPAQMISYLRLHHCDAGSIHIVRGSAVGWPTPEQTSAARALRAIPSEARAEQSRINGRHSAENGKLGGRPRKS
jgi:hypothetical protein